ncbi:Cleft lip and palate associated transmembrane protein 1 [Sparganum proliferum]
MMSSYRTPKSKAFNLINKKSDEHEVDTDRPITHWLSNIYVAVLNYPIAFSMEEVPPELHSVLHVRSTGTTYYYTPVFHVNPQLQSTSDWLEIPVETPFQVKKLALGVTVQPLSVGKLRLRCMLEQTSESLQSLGFKEKDVEDVRSLFTDTNIYLLMTTVIVSVLHLFFDFLAFKNDIQFWRLAENTAGLSIRTIIWRCLSTSIIFLYLFEERSSLLILVPSGISVLIEYWKLMRMTKVTLTFRGGLSMGTRNKEEQETDQLDAYFMHWLMIFMTPLCISGAIYSLLYMPHRSWYSWILQTAVNGVYAFGFLLMTPQLFINYRLKSVANLPWRALTYKAFNTFIDDFFAFIIKMPTAHRIACFRDDIVFVIYLYQRWLYPVDHTRVNEFGQVGEDSMSAAPSLSSSSGPMKPKAGSRSISTVKTGKRATFAQGWLSLLRSKTSRRKLSSLHFPAVIYPSRSQIRCSYFPLSEKLSAYSPRLHF